MLILGLLISSLSAEECRATHMIGGEIYYECLNPAIGSYLFTVKLYRDCFTGVPPFDDPIFVSIYTRDTSGNFVLYIQMDMVLPPSDTLDNNTYNYCLYAPPNLCNEAAVYEQIYILPPGEYYLTYQRCCRNQGILNLVNPQGVGYGFDIVVPDTNLAVCNSSPYYNNYPPTIICLDAPFEYDHSATDPDGDSLVYYLCAPNDYDNFVLGIIPNPSGDPNTNFTPPYTAPYDSLYPIWAPVDSFKIDPVTGLMTGTPTQAGRYVVAVCCSEYRNGVLLSTNSRDFQFNIATCLEDPLLQFSYEPDPCDNLTLNFTYEGNTVASYGWDFGVDSLISDTSDLENPSYTYPAIGTYPVTLVVNEDYYCADTLTIDVTPPNPLKSDFLWAKVCPYLPVDFLDASDTNAYTGPIVKWKWLFGDGGLDSMNQNTVHTYSGWTTYTAKLIITTSNGCVDTAIKIVSFFDLPEIDAGEDVYVTVGQDAELEANGGISYSWTPTSYLDDAYIADPIALPPDDIEYVVLGMSPDSCLSRDTVKVFVEDPKVTIPNAFSPNADGENDTIFLLHLGVQKLLEFKIFNRWGQLVFETADLTEGWDGMFKGEPQEIGNYAYYFKAESMFGNLVEGSGDIALIR